MKRRQLRGFDLRQLTDCAGLVGVDEAGRGALAGPVAAGAVLVTREFLDSDWCRRHTTSINDSKQLNTEQRVRLFDRLTWLMDEQRIVFAAGTASVAEIEERNILGATKLAMRRAIAAGLERAGVRPHPPDPLFAPVDPNPPEPGRCITEWKILLDGVRLRDLGFAHHAFVGGDARSLVIAMASVVAKVTRDRLMEDLEGEFSGYGFARHKGYATAAHREALLDRGVCPHHRQLFVDTFLSGRQFDDENQLAFAGGFEEPEASGLLPVGNRASSNV